MRKTISIILLLAIAFTLAVGCGPKKDEKKVVVSGKTFTEAALISEIMAQLLESKGFKVDRKYDMSSSLVFEALKKGEVDLSAEYTGSIVMGHLGQDIAPGTSAEATFQLAKDGLKDKYDMTVMPSLGFNNTYANAIRTDFAEANNIRTNSDLAAFSGQLVYGAEHSYYDRLDGYFNMCDTYGYEFKQYIMMDINLKQQSIKQGEIDVTNVYSTDGWLEGSGLTLLEDDLNYFPDYHLVPVVRNEILRKYPEVESILSVLTGTTTEERIIYYNNLVDIGGKEIVEVAKQFIKDNDLG
jgi:osmoprotectant transport system substrate-binding protein